MFVKNIVKEFIFDNKILFILYLLSNTSTYLIEYGTIPFIFSTLIKILSDNKNINYGFTFKITEIVKKKYVFCIIILFYLIYNFYYFINYKQNIVYNKIYAKITYFIRNKLSQHIINLKKENFKELETCKDLFSLEMTSKNLVLFLDIFISDWILLICASIAILSILLFIKVELCLVFGLYVIIQILFINYKKDSIINKFYNKEKIYLKMINKSENSFSNLANILINNSSELEFSKIQKLNSKLKNANFDSYNNMIKAIQKSRYIYMIFYMIILSLLFYFFKKKSISFQNIILLFFILSYYQNFSHIKLYNILLSCRYIGEININKEQFDIMLKKNKKSKKYNIKSGKIEFRNIKFKYTDKYIFNNLNLIINNNEKVAIIGKSGSGKSTLVKLLLKFYPLQKGNIFIDNININDFNVDYLRQNIYYINQNTNLFNESVYYNIGYNIKNINNKLINDFLIKYDLLNIFDKLGQKLNTSAGPNGTNLSLGMQKIVFLVRGLLATKQKKSKIIIFDEPLTALDSNTREKVIKMIKKECNNKTLIIITHDEEIIPHMDRVVNLKDLG